MIHGTSLAPGSITREQNGDRMQVWACRLIHPVRRIVRSGVPEHPGSRHHTVAELLRERRERNFIYAERPQAVPREGYGDPALFLVHRLPHGLRRLNLGQNLGEPGASAGGILEQEELVTTRERRRASQQYVLDVLKLEHFRGSRDLLHLVEHLRECCLYPQRLFHLIRAHIRVFTVFQEARALMISNVLDESRQVRFPILREALQIREHRSNAGLKKDLERILEVLVEIRVENTLVHEVQPRPYIEQDPPKIMEAQG